MQTLLHLFVPVFIALVPVTSAATPGGDALARLTRGPLAQLAPDEPFDEAALIGYCQSPVRVLVAERNSTTRVTLRVIGPKGKTLQKEVVDFPQPGDAPEFEATALRKWDKARALMTELKLTRGRSSSVAARRRGLLHTRFDGGKLLYLLTTAKGMEMVLEHALDVEPVLYPYFTPGDQLFLLVGRLDIPDKPAKGVVLVRSLAGLKPMSDKKIALALTEDARNRVAHDRYADAANLLETALKRKVLPEIQYTAALVKAYRGKWHDARNGLAKAVQADAAWQAKANHEPLFREARLRGFDINGDSALTFKASKGYEGTSVWVKVKDGNGKNIAIFKPTNGNTYHRGEVFTYQMAKVLGIEQMYPVTMLHQLDDQGCEKFVAALEKVKYKGMKERNRVRLIKKCRKGALEGAVKEWVAGFQFFQAIGTSEKMKKHKVFSYLRHRYRQPPKGKTVKAKTVTKYYKPDHCRRGTYKGTLDLAQLARDVSDLLIMDVLNANEDRFPGANIDFKSLGESKEVSDCVFDFGPSRLFSLDNGATFKGTYSNGYVDFTKRLKPTRFVRRTYERLKALDQFIKGKAPRPRFVAHFGIKSVKDLSRYLALDKGDSHKRRKEPFKLFTTNLTSVLKRLDRFADEDRAWFK